MNRSTPGPDPSLDPGSADPGLPAASAGAVQAGRCGPFRPVPSGAPPLLLMTTAVRPVQGGNDEPSRLVPSGASPGLLTSTAVGPVQPGLDLPVARVPHDPKNFPVTPAAAVGEPPRRVVLQPLTAPGCNAALSEVSKLLGAFHVIAHRARVHAVGYRRAVERALRSHRNARTPAGRASGLRRAGESERLAQAYQTICDDVRFSAGVLMGAVEGTPPCDRFLTKGARGALRDADPAARVDAALAQAGGILDVLSAWQPGLMSDLGVQPVVVPTDHRPGGDASPLFPPPLRNIVAVKGRLLKYFNARGGDPAAGA